MKAKALWRVYRPINEYRQKTSFPMLYIGMVMKMNEEQFQEFKKTVLASGNDKKAGKIVWEKFKKTDFNDGKIYFNKELGAIKEIWELEAIGEVNGRMEQLCCGSYKDGSTGDPLLGPCGQLDLIQC